MFRSMNTDLEQVLTPNNSLILDISGNDFMHNGFSLCHTSQNILF